MTRADAFDILEEVRAHLRDNADAEVVEGAWESNAAGRLSVLMEEAIAALTASAEEKSIIEAWRDIDGREFRLVNGLAMIPVDELDPLMSACAALARARGNGGGA